MRVCFNLPRLSEDLDFDYRKNKDRHKILNYLEKYLASEIKNKYFFKLETKVQSDKRIYLKFPILHKLDLSSRSESDKLFAKIETSDKLEPYAKFSLTPVSQFGFNFIVNHYDLPSLMSGKINAILNRLLFKGKKQEIDIKGRDFYDLYWFFENKIVPNWKMLEKSTGIKNMMQLKIILKERIKKGVTEVKLNYDLRNFIADNEFVSRFSKNYTRIMMKYL